MKGRRKLQDLEKRRAGHLRWIAKLTAKDQALEAAAGAGKVQNCACEYKHRKAALLLDRMEARTCWIHSLHLANHATIQIPPVRGQAIATLCSKRQQ